MIRDPNEETLSERLDLAKRGAPRPALTQISRPSAKKHWFANVALVAVFALFLSGFGIWAVRFRTVIPFIAALILLVCVVLIFNFIGRRRVRKHIMQFIADASHQPLEDLAASCLAVEGVVADDFRVRLEEFLRALVACGRSNNTLRIAPQERDASLKPFELPFEAQALDEADPNFIQLESQRDVENGEPSPPVTASLDDDATWRRVKRNVALRGGWVFAGIFLFATLLEAWSSYRRGSIDLGLVLYPGLLLLILFSTTGSWKSGRQWLALGGGLLLRKARWRDRQWRLYLFEPRHSALALYRQNKHSWILCVAQGDVFERTILTNREADFVLRAWLSPLSPPPVEKLSDLL